MRLDYHMHLEKGSLTIDYLEQFWQVARKRNIDEIGISEHGHNFREYQPIMGHLGQGQDAYPELAEWLQGKFTYRMDDYVALIEEGKRRGWHIKLGVEMDYIPGKEAEIARLIDAYPWDYVLGSVHFLGKWGFDFSPEVGWKERDIDAAYQEYFHTLQQAANTGLFDSITHPDLIKIFRYEATISLEPLYEAVAAALAEAGCCVEINAAGLRKPVGEIYPTAPYLQKCREKGVPITLACDAHIPADVGNGLDEAIELARSCGYTEVASFTRRQRVLQPLG